jgi:hypothetical protein
MDEADAAGMGLEDGYSDGKAGPGTVERLHENTTAGRRLGGINSGATARYDT